MESKKSNKIWDIVRLQQILKKWRKVANASKNNRSNTTATTTAVSNGCSSGGNKGIKFLKKTLSFSENSVRPVSTTEYVPKGYLAVCVGMELKRYVIPTDYLGCQAFGMLLREAEEEFGFHQEGVLKIPCDVQLFEKILQMVQQKRHDELGNIDFMSSNLSGCCSPDRQKLLQLDNYLPQLCR